MITAGPFLLAVNNCNWRSVTLICGALEEHLLTVTKDHARPTYGAEDYPHWRYVVSEVWEDSVTCEKVRSCQ